MRTLSKVPPGRRKPTPPTVGTCGWVALLKVPPGRREPSKVPPGRRDQPPILTPQQTRAFGPPRTSPSSASRRYRADGERRPRHAVDVLVARVRGPVSRLLRQGQQQQQVASSSPAISPTAHAMQVRALAPLPIGSFGAIRRTVERRPETTGCRCRCGPVTRRRAARRAGRAGSGSSMRCSARGLGPAAGVDRIAALINASGKRVLAVDIPSGLDADAGLPMGTTVPHGAHGHVRRV